MTTLADIPCDASRMPRLDAAQLLPTIRPRLNEYSPFLALSFEQYRYVPEGFVKSPFRFGAALTMPAFVVHDPRGHATADELVRIGVAMSLKSLALAFNRACVRGDTGFRTLPRWMKSCGSSCWTTGSRAAGEILDAPLEPWDDRGERLYERGEVINFPRRMPFYICPFTCVEVTPETKQNLQDVTAWVPSQPSYGYVVEAEVLVAPELAL